MTAPTRSEPRSLPRRLATFFVLSGLILAPAGLSGQQTHDHQAHAAAMGMSSGDAGLQAPGNAAFAALQEVVAMLSADENTDWAAVDLEALRQHLVDMDRFTLEADVVERAEVDGGLRVVVRGTNPEADASIRRALHAHAPMLEQEAGWSAEVEDLDEHRTALEVTTSTPDEVARIRGLGYIGLMTIGAHHQQHHLQIALGRHPHG